MAALTHLGVAFLTKPFFKEVNIFLLLLYVEVLDFIAIVFVLFGLEFIPTSEDHKGTNCYSHGVFMSLVWSVLISCINKFYFKKNNKISIGSGLLVFSHIVIDIITHPMTSVFPNDTKLSIFFEGSPKIGFGLG